MPYGTIDLCQQWLRQCLATFSVPSHYPNQCRIIVNPQEQNWIIFFIKIQTFEPNKLHLEVLYAKCQLFLIWLQCVNSSPPSAVYVSVNWVIIGSGNGLSPLWCQAITWTNAGLLSIGLLSPGNMFHWNLNQNFIIFIEENAFENVVW